jgi:2-oxoglutarate dehydrogenase E2 component (dihydrolipoamide succinyltransferase)
MSIEVRVPALPESVSDGVVAGWHKQPGDAVRRDEPLVDIETDKVVLEVPAPQDGVLDRIMFNDGDTVTADQVIAVIGGNGAAGSPVMADPDRTVTDASTADHATAPPAPGPAARRLVYSSPPRPCGRHPGCPK